METERMHRDSAYARSVVPRGSDGWDRETLALYARSFAEAYFDPPTRAWMHPATVAALELDGDFPWSDVLGDDTSGVCTIMDDPDYREDILILYR